MEQFIIEQAKPEDAALLLDYMKAIGGETDNLSFGAEDIHINVIEKAKQLAAQQQSKDNVLFVAKAAGAILGDASLERMPRRMNHRGEFGIAVRKAWWGCGVASALMKEILKFAKANGFEQLNLEVRSDNTRAIQLYEKFGFQKLCTFPAFFKISGQYIDFDLMNLCLVGKLRGGESIVRIEHIAMYVTDLDRAKDFFVKYFDAAADENYYNKQTGFRSYFLNFVDGARLEIMTKPQMQVQVDSKALEHTGYNHIAFRLGSKQAVDELTLRLREDGYPVVSEPRMTGDGYYESCIAGIEGNLIEITE